MRESRFTEAQIIGMLKEQGSSAKYTFKDRLVRRTGCRQPVYQLCHV